MPAADIVDAFIFVSSFTSSSSRGKELLTKPSKNAASVGSKALSFITFFFEREKEDEEEENNNNNDNNNDAFFFLSRERSLQYLWSDDYTFRPVLKFPKYETLYESFRGIL